MSRLSKSQFIRGLQCHKSLWLYRNRYDLRTEPDAAQLAIFEIGSNVGTLAQEIFPYGHEIVYASDRVDENVKKTKELIDSGVETIYEASFMYDNILVMVDILHKGRDGWELYEVKSSTEEKSQHLNDISVQYYVLTGNGLDLSVVALAHINSKYQRNGDLDIKQLFAIKDLTDAVVSNQLFVKDQLAILRNMLDSEEPDIDIGPHCSDPYECDFREHCWKHVPEYSIFNIYRLRTEKKFALYQRGITKFEDIPDDYPLNQKQQIQVDAELTGEGFIDKTAIEEFLSQLEEPIGFLDFETFQQAIPSFDLQRPYQQITFQYSLHILENGNLEHFEYLGEPGSDPRIELISRMISETKDCKTILVYSKGFENTRIKEMSMDFPDKAAELMAIIDRVVDQIVPFRAKQYYTKEMKGRESIKVVLPALVPEMSYDDLEISDGGMAMMSYAKLQQVIDTEEIDKIKSDLLEYCGRDTFAMVKILEKMKEVVL